MAGRLAAIGIGSNSTRLLVAERGPRGEITPLERAQQVTRLGGYAAGPSGEKLLSQEAIEETADAVQRFVLRAREMEAALVGILATEAARAAANRDVLVGKILDRVGVRVTVISGEEEAALGWRAVSKPYAPPGTPLLVVDIGGASAEISSGYAGEPRAAAGVSVRVGARTQAKRFSLSGKTVLGVLNRAVDTLAAEIEEQTAGIRPEPQVAIVMGGTAGVLSAVYGDESGQGHSGKDALVKVSWLEAWLPRIAQLDMEGRVRLGVPSDRADVIVAGGAILLAIAHLWRLDRFYISQRNILDGFLEQRANEQNI